MYVILQPKIQYINDMKKIALVFAFAVMSFAAVAQDTMHFGSQYYMFNELENPWCVGNERLRKIKMINYVPLVGYVAQRNDSVTVYGIAYLGWLADYANIGVSLAKRDSGFVFSRYDTTFYDTPTIDCYYYIYKEGLNCIFDTVVPLYEIYFDSPHVMKDTFYLTCWTVSPYDTSSGCVFIHTNHETPNIYMQMYGSDNVYPSANPGWGMFFPIVQPRCPRPELLTVTVEGGEVLFGWAEGNPQYELSVARRGTDPDSGSLFATTDTAYSLAGLDSGVWYTARVRAACDRYDSLWWSAWSLPAHFYLGSTNPDSLGIATAAEAQFMLSPNPAAGQVTVTAAEGLMHIEVYDARGALVYSAAADGTTAVVETKAWPAGQYVVAVETRAGKGSRVLTVTR